MKYELKPDVDIPLFFDFFPNEMACIKKLVDCYTIEYVTCPKCKKRMKPKKKKTILTCSFCGCEMSNKAGTIFQNSRFPLQTLFAIVWLLTVDARNLNTTEIMKLLGLKSYRLTWQWIQKTRAVLLYYPADLAREEVEIDKFKFKVKEKNTEGKISTREITIMVLINRDPSKTELLKMCDLSKMSNPDRNIHIREVISTDCRIYAPDRSWFYGDERGYFPMSIAKKNFSYNQYCNLPLPAMVAEEWHKWSKKHFKNNIHAAYLQGYLNTFIYHFNRPSSSEAYRYFLKALSSVLHKPGKETHQGRHH